MKIIDIIGLFAAIGILINIAVAGILIYWGYEQNDKNLKAK